MLVGSEVILQGGSAQNGQQVMISAFPGSSHNNSISMTRT